LVAALLLCGAANLGCRRLQPALRRDRPPLIGTLGEPNPYPPTLPLCGAGCHPGCHPARRLPTAALAMRRV